MTKFRKKRRTKSALSFGPACPQAAQIFPPKVESIGRPSHLLLALVQTEKSDFWSFVRSVESRNSTPDLVDFYDPLIVSISSLLTNKANERAYHYLYEAAQHVLFGCRVVFARLHLSTQNGLSVAKVSLLGIVSQLCPIVRGEKMLLEASLMLHVHFNRPHPFLIALRIVFTLLR